MNKKRIRYAAAALLTALFVTLTACSGSKIHPIAEQKPGTVAGDVYLSKDSQFILDADSDVWQVKDDEDSGSENLYLTKANNVWVSFSETPGLSAEMVAEFETSFVDRYMEGVRTGFPDAKAVDSEILSEQMARLDMTMTYGSGLYSMKQILYLVTDGENGYIITATLPEGEAEKLSSTIYKLVESLQFTEDIS